MTVKSMVELQDVMNIYPIDKKFEAFNFNVMNIDGHNFDELINAFDTFIKNNEKNSGKPTVIIAKTFMGKGVSFMNDQYKWHGNPPNEDQTNLALSEL